MTNQSHVVLMEEIAVGRRERERLARRTAMLDAARAVFAEKGFVRATVDEIAQRAEFGKGTLYNYFEGGKDEILAAILDELFDDIVGHVERTFGQSTTFQAALRNFCHSYMEDFLARREVYIILMKEMHRMMLGDDPQPSHYIRTQRKRVVDSILPHIRRAQDAGEIRALGAEALVHTILGNIQGVQMHFCLEGCADADEHPEFSAGDAADFISTLLLHGLTARTDEGQS